MESIIIYPKNEKQKSLLRTLFEEMKIHYKMSSSENDSLLTEDEFLAKIDRSMEQAQKGKTKKLSADRQKDFLSQ